MIPLDRQYSDLDSLSAAYGLDSERDKAAVADAYAAFKEHHGPFVTSIAEEMLQDLRASVEEYPDTQIVFVGRDGLSLAVATRALDPEFFDAHCHDAVLSRALVEAAILDLERHGEEFPQVAGYRENTSSVAEADVVSAHRNLTQYMHRNGVPVGTEGSRVTLVDSCLKGTVQELMAAAYPETEFTGRYMFFDGIANDPHPGSKIGYVLNRDAGIGGGMRDLPEDPALTFGSLPAIRVIENALQGPLSSPKGYTPEGDLAQSRLMDVPDRTWGCNPILIAEPYRDPAVREATKIAALLAVRDSAREVAAGAPLDTAAVRERFTEQTRAWLQHEPGLDPSLKTVLDSFVHRDDHKLVRQLDKVLHEGGFSPESRQQAWVGFDQAGTLEAKAGLVERAKAFSESGRAGGSNPEAPGAERSGGSRQVPQQRPPSGRPGPGMGGPNQDPGGRRR